MTYGDLNAAGDLDNGMLAHVPGIYVGEAAGQLPNAETATQPIASTVVTVPHLGPMRITFTRKKMRHGKHSHWAWVAAHAEAAVSD